MPTFPWTTTPSGLWTTATNWSPNQVPSSADTALVNQAGSYLIGVPGTASAGTIIVNDAQAAISISGTLNAGTLTIDAGTVDVQGVLNVTDLTNTGTILNTGSLSIAGTTDGASLSRIGGSEGVLNVEGVVVNSGGILDGTSLSQQGITDLGTIVGGTIANLTAELPLATLDDVTWEGSLDAIGTLAIANGLTLLGPGGVGMGTLSARAFPTHIEFIDSQTFDNASIVGFGTIDALAGQSIPDPAAVTLTLGSGATFVQPIDSLAGDQGLGFAGDTIVNNGSILTYSTQYALPNLPTDGTITIESADFENAGVIDAMDMTMPRMSTVGPLGWFPGEAIIDLSGSTFVNDTGGLIEVGQSFGFAELTIAASVDFTNNGTLLTQDSAPTSIEGGTIDIAAFLAGNGTVDIKGDGTVELENAAASSQLIDFADSGTLILQQPQLVSSTIDGFGLGDDIRLGLAATGLSYTDGDLKLQIVGGGTFDLTVTGPHALSDFVITAQSNSTDIQLACFARGTRLASARGAVPVETLHEGDAMLLADGNSLPIVWIGHRNVDCRRHSKPRAVWPVRVAAGAFGSGVPKRDLYLSPDHAIVANDVLIPVKHLVNGTSITQCVVDRVEYWHLELPRHAILLAEGLSVESLLPGSSRTEFDNSGQVSAPNPQWNWECEGAAPLVVTGPQVEAVRRQLSHYAAARPAWRLPRRRRQAWERVTLEPTGGKGAQSVRP